MTSGLRLRKQSQLEARLRRNIGAGCRFPFTLNDEIGWLQLDLLQSNPAASITQTLQCELGALHFKDAEAVCSLISACPLLLQHAAEEDDWYWLLFNQYLSDELRCLLGKLVTQGVSILEEGSLWLMFRVVLGERQGESQLAVSLNTLALLLNKNGWQPITLPLAETVPFMLPLLLGSVELSVEQLQTLQHHDVVLPSTRWFSPDGCGALRIANVRLEGELINAEGKDVHFYITHLEITDVHLASENDIGEDALLTQDEWLAESEIADRKIRSDQKIDGDTEEGMEEDGVSDEEDIGQEEPYADNATENTLDPTVFYSLPLVLTLRCGNLKLTLGELSRLSAGATLLVDNIQPGEAILCHGDFPLAKGELVDVEGRLGLQITCMLPGAINPLDNYR